MTIHLDLTSKEYVFVSAENNKVFLPEEKLSLYLKSSMLFSEYTVRIENGPDVYEAKGVDIEIPEYMIHEGVLLISICGIIRGKVAIRWTVDPIHLVRIDGGYEMLPEVVALEKRMERMESAILELRSLLINNM